MKVIKVKRNRDYTTIHNHFLKQPKMSLKTKGLMAYLLSLPNDWRIYVTELANNHLDGVTAIKGALKELESFGYLSRDRMRNEKGVIIGMEYVLREVPQNPSVENPPVDNPSMDNRTLINTNNTNEVLKQSIDKKGGKIYPKELNMDAWLEWCNFRKKEYRLNYKDLGEKKAIAQLLKLSCGDKEKQQQIVDQSMANGWKGLFSIKNDGRKSQSDIVMDAWETARNDVNNGII